MSSVLRVCLYNVEPEASDELRAALGGLNFVRLQEEVNSAEALVHVLREPVIGLIVFHLDPDPESVFPVIDLVSSRHPNVASLAVSHRTDPATILAAMRAGCDQFVCEPIVHNDFEAAVTRVATRRLSLQNKSRTICVVGGSGGAGATAIACNLALELGNQIDSPCALIDLDLQFGNVAANFDCQPKYTLRDVAELGADLDRAAMASTMTELSCKVALLGRPESVSEYEAVTPATIQRISQLLGTLYECQVYDLPRILDERTFAAIEHADHILLIGQLLVPSIRNAQRMYEALLQVGVQEDRIQMVINRQSNSKSRIQLSDVEDVIGKPVFASVPNDFQLVTQSVDFGHPFAALGRDNPVRVAIRRIARLLVGDRKDAAAESGESKGFFGRLLRKTPERAAK